MKLPTAEQHEVLQFVHDAERMAAHGRVQSGLSLLLTGLLRACADQESGEPCAEALIQAYDQAMDDYAERHALRPRSRPRSLGPCFAS